MAPIGAARAGVLGSGGPDIPDSGVSLWEYEDDSDTSTAIDSWGTEDGSINGAAYTTDSQVGSHALSFVESEGDYVGPFTNAAYSFSGSFSLGAWIKANSFDTRRPVLSKGHSRGFNEDVDYYLSVGDDTYRFAISDGNNNDMVSGGTVSTGTFTHIVGVFDAGTEVAVYADGSLVDSTATGITPQDQHNLRHGSGAGGGSTAFFDGIIDDPRVYDTALTPTEISNWHSTGSIDG